MLSSIIDSFANKFKVLARSWRQIAYAKMKGVEIHKEGTIMNPEVPINPNDSQSTTPPGVIGSAPAPTPEQPQAPQKKFRKGIVISLSIAGVLIIGIIATVVVSVSNLSAQAKDAAVVYEAAVETHATQLIDAPSVKDRLDSYPKRPTLKSVPLGESFSNEYKVAKDLQVRYNTLLDDTYQIVSNYYTTIDIQSFLQELSAKLREKPTDNSLNIVDDASLASAKEFASSLRSKYEGYSALAERFKAYTFAQKYHSDQACSAAALVNMSKTWEYYSDVTNIYIELSAKALEAQKNGDADQIVALTSAVTDAKSEIEAILADMRTNYSTYTSDLSTCSRSLVTGLVADNYINTMKDNHLAVLEQLEAFKQGLAK